MTFDVSVVVGTYGEVGWAELAEERALPSARAQSRQAVEVIHVHGRSLASARNAGACAATGEWIAFLDADDALAPGYLAAMEAAAPTDRRAAVLQPAVTYLREDGSRVERGCLTGGRLIEGNYLVIGTLVQREVFWAVGGFGDEPILEDWALWLRVVDRYGAEVVQVPAAEYLAWEGDGRNSDDHTRFYWWEMITRQAQRRVV